MSAGPRRDLHEANRLSWNEATKAHNSHKRDQARFFREGGSQLRPEELELLGDVRGLDVVHLQCNSGQDTLSLARLGARLTGVDISDEAVAFARKLSDESGIAAAFHRADVFDWLEAAGESTERWDIAFASYGALVWLSDVARWAAGIAGILRPGGRLVLVEFHPIVIMCDEEYRMEWPYSSSGEAIEDKDGVGDYVAVNGPRIALCGWDDGVQDFKNPHRAFEFCWGIADVVGAVLDAGLRLEILREFPYSNGYRPFREMRELPGRRWAVKDGFPSIPLMYGLVARKA